MGAVHVVLSLIFASYGISESYDCDSGWFGVSCENKCHCAESDVCDPRDGSCPGRCDVRWMGHDCYTTCPKNMYVDKSNYCGNTCRCAKSEMCRVSDGMCEGGGCQAGWKGHSCQERCADHAYGAGCVYKCECVDDRVCDKTTGKCPVCPKGLYGPNCTSYYAHRFGDDDMTVGAIVAMVAGSVILVVLVLVLSSVVFPNHGYAVYNLFGIHPPQPPRPTVYIQPDPRLHTYKSEPEETEEESSEIPTVGEISVNVVGLSATTVPSNRSAAPSSLASGMLPHGTVDVKNVYTSSGHDGSGMTSLNAPRRSKTRDGSASRRGPHHERPRGGPGSGRHDGEREESRSGAVSVKGHHREKSRGGAESVRGHHRENSRGDDELGRHGDRDRTASGRHPHREESMRGDAQQRSREIGPQNTHHGHAPPGHAPPGHAPLGHAPPGHAPHGHAPPGHAPHGHAPHGHAPPGHAPHGHAPHGHAPPGRAPPGHAPPTIHSVSGYYANGPEAVPGGGNITYNCIADRQSTDKVVVLRTVSGSSANDEINVKHFHVGRVSGGVDAGVGLRAGDVTGNCSLGGVDVGVRTGNVMCNCSLDGDGQSPRRLRSSSTSTENECGKQDAMIESGLVIGLLQGLGGEDVEEIGRNIHEISNEEENVSVIDQTLPTVVSNESCNDWGGNPDMGPYSDTVLCESDTKVDQRCVNESGCDASSGVIHAFPGRGMNVSSSDCSVDANRPSDRNLGGC